MKTLIVATLLLGLATGVSRADENDRITSLEERIVSLEHCIENINAKLRRIEAAGAGQPDKDATPLAEGDASDIKNWRRLRHGMEKDEVLALLGQPEEVVHETTWAYPHKGFVHFDKLDLVRTFTEPPQLKPAEGAQGAKQPAAASGPGRPAATGPKAKLQEKLKERMQERMKMEGQPGTPAQPAP